MQKIDIAAIWNGTNALAARLIVQEGKVGKCRRVDTMRMFPRELVSKIPDLFWGFSYITHIVNLRKS